MSTLLPFAELDLKNLSTYYQTSVEVDGRTIQLDLNIEDSQIDEYYLNALIKYLNNIPSIIEAARNAINKDFNTGTDVLEFLTFHIEEFDEEELEKMLSDTDPALSVEEQLLSFTYLKRIGFYPYTDEHFAIIDYTFGDKISQYVLVVKMNTNYEVQDVTYES